MYHKLITLSIVILLTWDCCAQTPLFTHQDTLRGSITDERVWWDLLHYDLDLKVDIQNKYLKGTNIVRYKVLDQKQVMQIDLQQPMKISRVYQNNKELDYNRIGNAYFIKIKSKQIINSINELYIEFEGSPKISKNPPWDDGLTWRKDQNGKNFIATTSQGGGASIWWPCKDHMYDEPDSGMSTTITVPNDLVAVSNGRLKKITKNNDQTKSYKWQVVNPINNYGVNMNIGDYTHFSEIYNGEKGHLDCDYYVLSYNIDKAKDQFKQVSKMLKAFEYWFGPYPFYEDSYKLVEVPYLGMEHQSSVTYGNNFKNGYLGRDLSGSGWGLKFDFIIIHESGHEWYANNITYKDIADMWIHESFTAYSENLYLDYYFGTQASSDYVIGTRHLIQNDKPIIGPYNVNKSGSGDMYYKGANMLHMLRQIVNNDKKWRTILRGMNAKFYHQTVNTKQIEDYLSQQIGINLKPFFDQYLRTTKIPKLKYYKKGLIEFYKWDNIVEGFKIPVKIILDKDVFWIHPDKSWKKLHLKNKNTTFKIDKNFYISSEEVTGSVTN
jgi:aminopeptidase N